MNKIPMAFVALLVLAEVGIVCAQPAPAGGDWTAVVRTPTDQIRARGFARLIAAPELDAALLWGPPAAKSDKDWCMMSLDLAAGQWKPLLPAGKEGWLAERPKMRLETRWGAGVTLESPDGLLQPAPMCCFNQAVYVPTMNKALFFLGGKSLAFDPKQGTWEELKPKTSPPLVVWGALCYDPTNDEVVLFGGGAMCDENRPGTWLFSPKDGEWRRLDQPLAEQPPARCNATLAFDSKNKLIAVFGGDAQDHFLSDTWVYDCTKRRWRELKTDVQPYPRVAPALCFAAKLGQFVMGGQAAGKGAGGAAGQETWLLDAAAGKWTVAGEVKFPAGPWNSMVYDAKRDRVVCYQTTTGKESAVWQWTPAAAPAGKGTPAPAKPVTKYFGPEWYTEGASPDDAAKATQFIAALKPNEWAKVAAPKAAPLRTWGSATVDTDAHEVIYWGGGHCGYCGTDVSHFSLKTLRWTGSFQPEFPAAPYNGFYGEESSFLFRCRSFHGRPWVQHGRTSYAYDPTTKLVAFTQSISDSSGRSSTYVYDPAKRDFVDRFAQPFIGGWSISGAVTTTAHGIYDYLPPPSDQKSPQAGLFKLDLKARAWANLSDGKATVPCPESRRMVYDSKRDRLVLLSMEGSRNDGQPAMYAWDLKDGKAWSKLEMTGELPRAFYRESVYLPKSDRVLNLNEGGLFTCDLAGGNKWSKTGIALPAGVKSGPSASMVYEPGTDLLVLIDGNNTGPANVWLMRCVP